MESAKDLRNRKDQIATFIRATREKIMCMQVEIDVAHDTLDHINTKLSKLKIEQKEK